MIFTTDSERTLDVEITSPAFAVSTRTAHQPIAVARPFGTLICMLLADVSATTLALYLAAWFRFILIGGPTAPINELTVAANFFVVCSFVAAGLYPGVCENPIEELRRTILAVTLAFLSLGASTFIAHDLSLSRLIVLLANILALFFVPLARTTMRSLFAGRSWWGFPVVIMGLGATGQKILKTLTSQPHFGLKPVAVLDDDPGTYGLVPGHITTGTLSSCVEITRQQKISYCIICMPGLSRNSLLRIISTYGPLFSHVMVIPDLMGMASLGVGVREVGGIVGIEVSQSLLRPSAQLLKRIIDLCIAVPASIFALPLLGLVALATKLESKGPVFFLNERIGFGGYKFGAWKLRSMVMNGDEVLEQYLAAHPAERKVWERTQKLRRDPRVTRIGRIIRQTSIDELPQLWNVLKGEMSIVGPRPFLESQIAKYGPTFDLYKRVRPGITGLWQISGRNRLGFDERVQLDAYLIQNWSVWLDIYIISRTVMAVLTARGAY